MNRFNYEAYAGAINGLALLPAELQQNQQKEEASYLNKKRQIEEETKSRLYELERTERIAFQQFDEIACEYKALFAVPVSRPKPIPTPLSTKDAVATQNVLAVRLKSQFENVKQAAVEKKRLKIEAEKKEQARLAAIKAEQEERIRQQAEDAERQREEEYLRQLEQENRSMLEKFVDFLAGQ